MYLRPVMCNGTESSSMSASAERPLPTGCCSLSQGAVEATVTVHGVDGQA